MLRDLGDRRTHRRNASHDWPGFRAMLDGPIHAARIWGGAERLREEINVPIPPGDRPDYERQITAARATLADDAAFDRAWREGHAMTLDETIECALAPRRP